MPGSEPQSPQIPEERRFVWRNLDAYLAGELAEADRARIEAFLCECPYTREYVQTEQQMIEAVRRCMDDAPECPQGLRERVVEALDRCEAEGAEGEQGPAKSGFPWLGAAMLAAASILLLVALAIVFGGGNSEPVPPLPEGLAPMVAHVSLDAPHVKHCHYKDALAAYRKFFADGPDLPIRFGDAQMKVAKWECEQVNGRRVMCAVYDAPNGERFGVMVFRCNCLEKSAPESVRAAEVMVDGKTVLLWREGRYFRALVGQDPAALRRHMEQIRKPV